MFELGFGGRVAVVTGAGRGIGRELSLELARRGASVVVADYGGPLTGGAGSEPVAQQVAAEIARAGGNSVAVTASVAEEAGVAAIVDAALETFGRVDIVANFAGITDPRPFAEETAERMRLAMDVMFFGGMMLTKAAWPHMIAQGGGRVLNACSSSLFGLAGYSGYVAAKGAIFGLTRALAPEGEPLGIRVNALAPVAATRMTLHNPDLTDQAEWIGKVFATRYVIPAAIYLLHESCQLNGEVLGCSGGAVSAWKFGETNGIVDRALSAETIRDRLDEITGGDIGVYRTQSDQAARLEGDVTKQIVRQMEAP